MSITTEPLNTITFDRFIYPIIITEETGVEIKYYANSYLSGKPPQETEASLFFYQAEMDALSQHLVGSLAIEKAKKVWYKAISHNVLQPKQTAFDIGL